MSPPLLDCFEPCAALDFPPGSNYDEFGVIALFGGIAISCIASVLTQKGPRRILAIATLFCLGLSMPVTTGWAALFPVLFPAILMLVLISVIYWPIRSQWVNLPLVSGAATASLAFMLFAIEQNTRYY